MLVVTNMWPTGPVDFTGIFVKQQVESLRAAAPDRVFDVLHIAGPRGRGDYLAAIPRVRDALRRGYSLVHAHYGFTGLTAALAMPRAPLVITMHGNDVNWRWQRPLSRLGAARAREVIAVSEQLAETLGRPGTRVLPCGVPMELYRPLDRAEARRRLGLPAEGWVLLFPADPANPVKDHPLFLQAVARLPDPVRRKVSVRALGRTPPEAVPWEMAAADAVVLTSVAEGSPMVVKEALACGTPVVAVDVGDVRQVLDGVPGCVVTPRAPEPIATGILRVLDDVAGREGGAGARRQRIRDLALDADSVAHRLLGIYEDAMSTQASR